MARPGSGADSPAGKLSLDWFGQPLSTTTLAAATARQTNLFVLNHYSETARFEVKFPREKVDGLVNLSSGEIIPVRAGRAQFDHDRKSGELYAVQADGR